MLGTGEPRHGLFATPGLSQISPVAKLFAPGRGPTDPTRDSRGADPRPRNGLEKAHGREEKVSPRFLK